MKKILGLDIGTTSIGWAVVNEAENDEEKSSILKLGVRVVPITTDEENDFQKGKSITINANRTLKRGMRRNLDRYQIRRNTLIHILKKNKIITDNTTFNENDKNTTFLTYMLRAKAADEKINLDDFAKVLLMINKKRGYKSNRKTKTEEEGTAIEGMEIAKYIYNNNITPGQFIFNELLKGKKNLPDFYRSDFNNELDKIWKFQNQFYPQILTDKLRNEIAGKNKGATWKILEKPFNLNGIKLPGKKEEVKLEIYRLRDIALSEKIDLELLSIIFQEINTQINNSSGYLGEISDRSKELYFNKQTVGQYLYNKLKNNPHESLKNKIFYRQDYLDEFEKIWEKQKQFSPELTNELKTEIRDVIIFYQRPLKSQKGLLGHCEFESWQVDTIDEQTGKQKSKIIGHRVIPKSSPLFQEFKIWQNLNNIKLTDKNTGEIRWLEQKEKEIAFNALNINGKISKSDFLKILNFKPKDADLNFLEIEGNKTNSAFFKVYLKIMEYEGVETDIENLNYDEVINIVSDTFTKIGINKDILIFNSELEKDSFDKQPIIQLWHILYSFTDDKSKTGNEKLLIKLEEKFGFKKEYAKLIANINLQDGYGSLSARAIRKILPHLKEGKTFDEACLLAGYNHSKSLTKEQNEAKLLKDKMELLPKNSLRNPIVEKILNQMVNVVNAIITDEHLGKPDEIRIELARELKKSKKEREETSLNITKAKSENLRIINILQKEFKFTKVTHNDIVRYRLWEELQDNGFKTLYTNYYISRDEIFSKKIDIEHIIPQAKLFDDSFSNKTLALRDINIDKGDETAYDYLKHKLSESEFNDYLSRIERLFRLGKISKTKYVKLKMKGENIPNDFVDRDLRNSQYIAKKAVQMLNEVVKNVNTTTGSITDRLRTDWQLINIMKEINLPKYEKLGLVKTIQGKDGHHEKQIQDWTKRNDHRHHAMDALTVAFTKHAHVQYLNNLNAKANEKNKRYNEIFGIQTKYLYRDEKKQLLFKPPMALSEFRNEAKKHIESILVSFKAKNKVVTQNKNKTKIKGKNNYKTKIELTPRGQLHKETVYGKIRQYETKIEKINSSFDFEKINLVANQSYRNALFARLKEFDGNPQKAFGGKNLLSKNPIFIDDEKTLTFPEKVKLSWLNENFTIRKEISPDLKIDKVIDVGIKNILQNRLDEFNGNAQKAFSNLHENPIWLNKEKGITIRRVSIYGVSNAEPLHYKKDHYGNFILDENGEKQPVDYVSTGNNHHVAIYKDEDGNLQDEIVSFFEAVTRVKEGAPIINKNKPGLQFLYTMKQNEYFVFPSDNFDPSEIDLLNPNNSILISPHLFRVQKFSKVEYGNSTVRDYVFRHHLETQLIDITETKDISYKIIKSLPKLNGIVKVRINHLGQIVRVGEY